MDGDDPVVPRTTVPAKGQAATPRDRGAEVARPDDKVIADRFAVDDELGRGGMGRVVSAHDRVLDRVVAIKEATSDAPAHLARFEREVRITARLQHPAIVPLYDAGHRPDGTPYYVMRRVDGRTLHDAIAACASLRERLALLPTFLAAADAVAYAHARATIHRDLKPANILVGEHGETIVIDWGLAKRLDDGDGDERESRDDSERGHDRTAGLTGVGAVVGTPGYMAPEQLRGEPADARTDVFALGATLAHVLDGSPDADYVPSPAVPRDLATIVAKAMAGERTARYADASGLAADVRRFLTGQLVAAHRYSFVERARRFARKHAAAIAVATAAVLAIAVTIGIAVSNVVSARDRAVDGYARANERGEELLLARADALLDSDPTLAALVAAALPEGSPHWSRSRSILAAARHRGIARAIDFGADPPLAIRPDPTSRFLATLDASGDVAVIDLATRAPRKIARIAHAQRLEWLGSAVVVAADDGIHVLDATHRRIATVGPPTLIAARGRVAWRDGAGASMLVDPAGEPQLLAPAAGLGDLAISDDGRWLALWNVGERVQLAHDGAQIAIDELHGAAAFSADGAHCAVATPTGVVEIELGTAPVATLRWVTPNAVLVTYAGDQLYALTRDGQVVRVARNSVQVLATSRDVVTSTAAIPGGIAVATGDTSVALVRAAGTTTLHAPRGRVRGIAATPSGRWLFAAGLDGAIVMWDLAELATPIALAPRLSYVGFVSDDTLIGCVAEQCTRWRPRDDARSALKPFATPVLAVLASPAGDYAIAVEASRRRSIVRVADGARSLLGGDGNGELFAFAGPEAIAFTRDRDVWLQHPGHPPERLARLDAAPRLIVANAATIVIVAGDHVWQRDARSGSARTIATVWPLTAIAAGADGAIVAASGRTVLALSTTGARVVAMLSAEVTTLRVADGTTSSAITAATADGGAHRIANGRVLSVSAPAGTASAVLAANGIAVAHTADHRVVAIDPEAGTVHPVSPAGTRGFEVSPGGNAIVTSSLGGAELVRDDIPRDPAAAIAWLRAATNADLATDLATVHWR